VAITVGGGILAGTPSPAALERRLEIAECLIGMALFEQGARAAKSGAWISLLWLDKSELNAFSGTRKQSVGNECQRASD